MQYKKVLKYIKMNYKNYFDIIPIFNFHEIAEKSTNAWTLSASKFEKFIEWLFINKKKIITMDKLVDVYTKLSRTPNNFVVLTFDDGRKGVINYALPILKKFGYTATVFVVNDWLYNINIPKCEQYSLFLNIDDIHHLIKEGFEVGYHSKSHECLLIQDKRSILNDIVFCKRDLEKKLNIELSHFSYPYGHFDTEIRKLLEESGEFRSAVSNSRDYTKDLFKLPRISVKERHTTEDFESFFELNSWKSKYPIVCNHYNKESDNYE